MRLSLLGSTGSIGTQALEVAEQLNRTGTFPVEIAVLAARSNVQLLEQQARRFSPQAVALFDPAAARDFRQRTRDLDITVLEGPEGLCEAAAWEGADTTLNAVVGMVGLRPTMAAIKAKKTLALANKETLVAGGSLVIEAARQNGVKILPVDSEHSAIFQCLQGSPGERAVKRLILTASGGPFFGWEKERLQAVTPKQALCHPNWDMGAKITIDCATLMNKGLEFIEAMRLFCVTADEVEVVIHRQSIIHSMVEFRDGAVLAQMGTPDMRLPIRYALTYPERMQSELPGLDLLACPPLTFAPPDLEAFPCLKMAMECARIGGTSCAVLNGANEAAVELFRREEIAFGRIPELVERALDAIPVVSAPGMEDILEADRQARACVRRAAGS